MKKSGYTLAEILIALTIAGIVAGLVLPMAGKIRPNANKMAFLHTYDSIVQLTHSIAADETFYPEIDVDEGGKINYGNYPLWNIHPKSPDGNTTYEQAKKYCQILAEGLKADSNACSNNTITPFGNQKSFATPNGVDFWVNTERGTLDKNDDDTDKYAIYQSSVHFDVNGIDQGENCIYNAGTCPHPDRFTLFVASDGKVVAADQMSQHYLNTRTNFRFNKDEVPNTNALTILARDDRRKEIKYINKPEEEEPEEEEPEELDEQYYCGDFLVNGKRVICINHFVKHQYYTKYDNNGNAIPSFRIESYGLKLDYSTDNMPPDLSRPLTYDLGTAPRDLEFGLLVAGDDGNPVTLNAVIKKGDTKVDLQPIFPLTEYFSFSFLNPKSQRFEDDFAVYHIVGGRCFENAIKEGKCILNDYK